MRRRSTGSILQDLQRGLTLIPRPVPVVSGVGGVGSPDIAGTSITGGHYAETRNVIPFVFDDSIDPTHPLDCFFQMPAGVLKIYSAKLWVKPDAFRSYATGSSSSGSSLTSSSGGAATVTSGGGSTTTTSSAPTITTSTDGPHAHNVNGQSLTSHGTHGHAGSTTDSQGVHNHGTNSVEDASYASHDHATGVNSFNNSSHSHLSTNDGGHAHNTSTPAGSVTDHGSHVHDTPSGGTHLHNVPGHSHTVDMSLHTHSVVIGNHTHTVDTTHTHGITYGIFVSGASTGTLSVKLADDGVTFGADLASGASITAVDLKQFLSLTAGDRQLRVSTTGAGVLARVKVLLMLDVLLKVDLS